MHPKQSKQAKRPRNAERPFPWRCRQCGEREVVLAKTNYAAAVRHDGRLHEFTIAELELPVCQACGERVFTEKVDAQVNDALRGHLNLLTPAQMRDAIKRVGMSQKDLANCLGIAEATLSRWVSEVQIQSRSMDNLLRVFFGFPEVRVALRGGSQVPQLGLSDAAQPGSTSRT
jgi:putative zinc finger/helix-turn-helix YgiT family protein